MAKVVLRNREVAPALGAVQTLQVAKASGAFKLKLARMAMVLRQDLELLQDGLRQLQDAHVEKDESGQPKKQVIQGREIDGTVVYKDPAAFAAAERELADGVVELELPTVSAKEIEGLEFEGSIEGLLPLIRE